MGNSGSRQGDERRHEAAVIPSTKYQQHLSQKVLLDLNAAPKLRATENGVILHSGGTISQRRPDKPHHEPSSRGESNLEFRRNFYGSEPDLRFGSKGEHSVSENSSKLRVSRTRKKYKAPQAPQHDHGVPDYFDDWEGKPSRRLRLFLTRAETKKKSHEQSSQNAVNMLPPNGRLRRSLSTPQFQQEQELPKTYEYEEEVQPKCDPLENITKPPRMNPVSSNNVENGISKNFLDELREKQQIRENKHKRSSSRHSDTKTYNPPPAQTQEAVDEDLWLVASKPVAPVKTFYFGMDEPVDDPFGFDTFTSKVPGNSYSSSESHLSSADGFTDVIYDETSGGISVQLRATLPRKQIDIPRFSPAAAWRLLATIEPTPIPQEEEVITLESRIAAPPHPIQIPAVMDKSADSGISGDASPQQYDSAAWTPQQDLEETSSDGGFPINFLNYDKCSDVKYTPRFTLSLPKDDKPPLFSYTEVMEDLNQQIAKKSLFPFGKTATNSLNLPDSSLLDNNWMLSCSIPSSISFINNNNNFQQCSSDDPCKSFPEEDCSSPLIKKPSFSYLTSGGHIMYLPEYSKPKELEDSNALSKSCENLCKQPLPVDSHSLTNSDSQEVVKFKTKKFTFQSTIRQNERKMIAEKLSRLAEYTELKRRSEMEVMQKVEEEFQKKREREKADIRQQLRLFNISNKALASLESSASNP